MVKMAYGELSEVGKQKMYLQMNIFTFLSLRERKYNLKAINNEGVFAPFSLVFVQYFMSWLQDRYLNEHN